MTDSSNLSAQDLLKRFGPRRRDRFAPLRPHIDLIRELRHLKASFLTIFQALQFKGVNTSESTVRQFCLVVLEESAARKGRKRQKQQAPTLESYQPPDRKPTEPKPDPTPTGFNAPVSGPRIAKVEFLEPPKL